MTTETIPVRRIPRSIRPLNARQLAALQCIADRIRDDLPPPTFGEIATAIGSSSKGVANYHLRFLVDRGLITLAGPSVPRSIGVTAKARDEFHELFPKSPAELVMVAVQDARDEGEPLPARVLAALAVGGAE